MKLIIVENLQKLKMLFNVDCASVKTVVLMNSKPDEEIPTKEGVKVVLWPETLKAEGALNEARPKPADLGEYYLTLIGESRKQNPKSGNFAEHDSRKQNPKHLRHSKLVFRIIWWFIFWFTCHTN